MAGFFKKNTGKDKMTEHIDSLQGFPVQKEIKLFYVKYSNKFFFILLLMSRSLEK